MDRKNKVRYAVVGLGSIAQGAVLPAFEHTENSELTALVSGDEKKLKDLGREYKCQTYTYDQFDDCVSSGEVDAVYICTPNDEHRPFAEKAAREKVHVLCEKPLAQNAEECRGMIDACRSGGVRLMTAYRLHFEQANLEAVRICESGKLGDIRMFNSVFSQNVAAGNVRLTKSVKQGGGPLFDMGVYCINAARYLLRDEPVEVTAFSANGGDERFKLTGETVSVILRFPDDRLATFIVSFNAAPASRYTVVGTEGSLVADPAYDYSKDLK